MTEESPAFMLSIFPSEISTVSTSSATVTVLTEEVSSPFTAVPSPFTSTESTFVLPETTNEESFTSTEIFEISESFIMIEEPPFTTIEIDSSLLFFIVKEAFATFSETMMFTFFTFSRTTFAELIVSVFPPKSAFLIVTTESTEISSVISFPAKSTVDSPELINEEIDSLSPSESPSEEQETATKTKEAANNKHKNFFIQTPILKLEIFTC